MTTIELILISIMVLEALAIVVLAEIRFRQARKERRREQEGDDN